MRRHTVRVRLTALYAGLFLITATALLVTVNLLLRAMLEQRVTVIQQGPLPPEAPQKLTGMPMGHVVGSAEVDRAIGELPDLVLGFQWTITAITIVVLTVVSVGAGWWLAGRVLHPLHRITATARRLSVSNLHERIALSGPRDELKELADTFDAMLDRLEWSVDSQSRFVANASHELRTPLAIQRAAIEIGLTDPSPDRLERVRQELLDANRRSERLIDGLLLLAQSDRGLDDREPVPLEELLHQVVGEMAPHDLAVTLDTEPVTVSGDPVLLTRLVANIVHNAVRYNRPGGTVQVSLSAGGGLTVRNTGPEVPQDRIGELFEPFRRLNPTRTRSAGGSGLGLSIVASIAQAHGAAVTARPNPGGGLELAVRFGDLNSDYLKANAK